MLEMRVDSSLVFWGISVRGGLGWQITELFNKSGILQVGQSKHAAKADARSAGAKTWSQLGEALDIYSFATANTYKDTWHQFFDFARAKFLLKDIEKTTPQYVQAFLESRILDNVARATLQKEASALAKLEKSLNLYSLKFEKGNHYDFRPAIRETLKVALREIPKADPHRAYICAERIIMAIKDEKHRIAAQSQHVGGARIHEISLIKSRQLMGISLDDISGEKYGRLEVKGKGGKKRELILSLEIYEKITAIIRLEGEFIIDKNQYRSDLRQACEACGVKYNGSHGLRWTFAQNRMEFLQSGRGKTYEDALRIVSRDLGHQRPDVTEHYMR